MNNVGNDSTRSRLMSTLNPLSTETISAIINDTSFIDDAYLDVGDEDYFFIHTDNRILTRQYNTQIKLRNRFLDDRNNWLPCQAVFATSSCEKSSFSSSHLFS
jgi:hypothetical protein